VDTFSVTRDVQSTDLDANGHVHYSVYIDAAADCRYRFFAERGLPLEAIRQQGIGPVYTLVTARFLREVRAGETLTITYELSGLSQGGTRWRFHHDILKATGKKAAVLDIEGVILDLAARTPTAPTAAWLAVFRQIPRSAVFEEMPERFR